MNISTHTYDGLDIEISYLKGKLTYTFELDGKKYGNAVVPRGKKVQDIVDASFQLFTNAIETYEAAKTA